MIVGSLIVGLLSAIVSATLSLATGSGIFTAFGFYVLGGLLGMVGAIALGVFAPKALNRTMAGVEYTSEVLVEKA